MNERMLKLSSIFMERLGRCFVEELGVSEDDAERIELYRKSLTLSVRRRVRKLSSSDLKVIIAEMKRDAKNDKENILSDLAPSAERLYQKYSAREKL